MASQNRATSQRGDAIRRGAVPSTARAWAAGGSVSAIASRRARSEGSSGPIRQPSTPSSSIMGTRRPLAIGPRAARAARAQPWTEGPDVAPAGRAISSSSTRVRGTKVAGTERWRTLDPAGRTSSTVRLKEPGLRVGCHSASSPLRAGLPGTNTASSPGTDSSRSGEAIRSRIGKATAVAIGIEVRTWGFLDGNGDGGAG